MATSAAVRKAVIPAAGLGTRFLPATKAMPKEMLPVVDKPAIQYVVEEAVSAGVASFPDHGRTSSELMRSADGALYAAKHAGRDRWCLADGSGGKGLPVAQTG